MCVCVCVSVPAATARAMAMARLAGALAGIVGLNHCSAAAAAPTPFPPSGANWTRVPNNPVLPPTLPWEGQCTCENVVIQSPTNSSVLRMWYRGGWSSAAIGFANSTDGGLTWTKHPTPVYGGGGSGVHTSPGEPWVYQSLDPSNTTLLLYTTDNSIPAMNVSSSMDGGITWTPLQSSCPLPPNAHLFGNRVVWTEGGDGAWLMLHEAMVDSGPWETWLYTSPNGLDWTVSNGGAPLSSLQPFAGGMYGGPRFARVGSNLSPRNPNDGLYHLYYHAASGSGGLPTDIFHATSPDLLSWTITPRAPVLTHTGGSTFEHDQVAGPIPIVQDGADHAMLFYDGDNNVVGSCAVGAATAPLWGA